MRGKPIRYIDFRGGVNTTDAAYLVGENECRDCRNVVSTAHGSIRKRDGNTTFCSDLAGAPTSVASLHAIELAGTPMLIATSGTKLHKIDLGGTSSDITGALTLTSGTRWDFAQAPAASSQGPVYGVNGVDAPIQWTGSGNAAAWTTGTPGEPPVDGGSSDRPKFIETWENRVYLARSDAHRSRIWWSDIGNPHVWPVENVTDLDPDDGQEITGMGRVGPYLLVFKRSKTFVIYDSDTSANRVLSGSTGCIANRSIVETPVGTIWLSSNDGVVVTNGTRIEPISPKIQTTLDQVTALSTASIAAGGWWDDHYYLAVSTGGSANDLLLDYDTELKSWWMHTPAVSVMTSMGAAGSRGLYAGMAGVGRVDKLFAPNTTTDNNDTFYGYWLGPWLTFGEPYRLKRVREINLDGQGWITVGLGKDFAAGITDIDTFHFSSDTGTFGGEGYFGGEGTFGGSTTTTQRASLFTPGVARSWSLKLTTVDDDTTEVESITWLIQQRTD